MIICYIRSKKLIHILVPRIAVLMSKHIKIWNELGIGNGQRLENFKEHDSKSIDCFE